MPAWLPASNGWLLAKPATDSINRQRRYAATAAHELAHQWFGDLVTTAWWNDVWLNEAFADWMEHKLIAEWKPEWKTRLDDVQSLLGAERADSLVSARKIRQEIVSKGDIDNAFDGITYSKAGTGLEHPGLRSLRTRACRAGMHAADKGEGRLGNGRRPKLPTVD